MNLNVLGKNAVIYSIGTACLRFAALLLIPLYTRALSVSEFGLLSTLLITIQIMAIWMDMGTRKGFLRFAASFEVDNKIGHLIGSSILIILAGGAAITAAAVMWLLPLFRNVLHTDQVLAYVVLSCCAALAQSLFHHITSYYRIRNEGMKYTITGVAAMVLLIVCNLIFLLIFDLGVNGALLAQIISYGLLWLLICWNVHSRNSLGFSPRFFKMLLAFGFPLIFALSSDVVTDASALYLLSFFANLEHVAIYSLGQKFAMIASMVLLLPFQLAYEPFIYAHLDQPGLRDTIAKLLTYLMLAFTFVALAITFAFRDLLPVVATANYSSAYLVVFLLLPGVAFRGVYHVGESLLHIKNKTYVTGGTVVLLSGLSVALNYWLISLWGMYGAIVVFNLFMIVTAVVVMALGLKAFPIRLETGRLVSIAALFAFFLLMTYWLREASPYIFYSVVPVIALGGLAFLYHGRFLDDREKSAIRAIISRVQMAILP